MKSIFLIPVLMVLSQVSLAQEVASPETPDAYENMTGIAGRELKFQTVGTPRYEACVAEYQSAPRHQIIKHDGITIDYNGYHRVANWVYHQITAENLQKPTMSRSNNFKRDPLLVDQTPVGDRDYANSGFDRGHLVPSGDFNFDRELNSQTFYMTNMAPQTVSLNQKAWNALEEQVRAWACGLGSVKVYTGPIYNDGHLPHRLNSCVSVPHRFFKILLSEKDGNFQAIGFVYSQGDDLKKGEAGQWMKKAMSIDEIEQLTGSDFFSEEYSVEQQAGFEAQKAVQDWASAGSNECRPAAGGRTTTPSAGEPSNGG